MKLSNTRGSNSRTAKLTEKQARQIIGEYKRGLRGKANAHRFNISPERYNQIGSGKGWKHLTRND